MMEKNYGFKEEFEEDEDGKYLSWEKEIRGKNVWQRW